MSRTSLAFALLGAALTPSFAPPQDEASADWPAGRFGAYLRELGPWNAPADVAIGADGTVVVVERGSHRVVVLGPDGEKREWGELGQLDSPSGVALAPEGRILIADTRNDRVQAFTRDGTCVGAWGGLRRPAGLCAVGKRIAVADTGNGRVVVFDGSRIALELTGFERPVDVAADPEGNLFVVDEGAHRVSSFDAAGEPLHAWGDFGPEVGLFGHPSGITWQGGRVYVSDADNHRVQVFEPDGTPIYEWGKHALRPGEGEGSLHYPTGVAVSPDGSLVVVAEASQDRCQVFGPTEDDPALFSTDPAILPWKVSPHYGMPIAAGGDLLAMIEPETQTILVLDTELEEPVEISRFGGYGRTPGTFRELAGVAIDPATWTLWASDRGARTLSSFRLDHDPDAPLRQVPNLATFARSVDLSRFDGCEPGAIALGKDGELFVSDLRGGRVLVLSAGLQLVREIGADVLEEPVGLAHDRERGLLHVVDAATRRVLAFDGDGELRRTFEGQDELTAPHGVTVDASGDAYVSDAGADRIVRIDPSGEVAATWGSRGLGPGQLRRPRGLVVDGRGRLVVVDHGNHRGCIFDLDGTFRYAFGPRLYVKPTR